MKKILSLVLAIMMVLSMANVAFAAPVDVTDKNQQVAVDALMSLGIVKGYDDGSYKPEGVITRAEMAKLLVEAKGQGAFAQGSESSFKDTKGKWYDGYVAMAAGLDLVKGYPDGTFKGDNTVSYQEAVVMIIRSLGYTDATVNNGTNAYNEAKYKALAASLEILKNVTFKNMGANRGDVASMLYNALDVAVVETNEKGRAERIVMYTESVDDGSKTTTVPIYKTLIDNMLTAVNMDIEPAFVDPDKSDYKGKYVDLTPYMYQNVMAYVNKNKEIVVVKKVNSRIVAGTNDSLDSDHVDYAAGTLKITTESGTTKKAFLPVASTIKCYLNNRETNITGLVLSGDGYLAGAEVTFVLDQDNKVTAAVAKQPTYGILVTNPYKTGDVVLKGIEGNNNSIANIYLPKNGTKVDLTKVKVTGAVTAIEDIQKNDVVVAFASKYTKNVAPEYVELLVTRNTIEGTVTKTSSNVVLTIEDKAYYTVNYAGYYSGGLNNTVAVGSEGVFYLDQDDYIFAFSGKAINNSDYAVVLDITDGWVAPNTSFVADATMSILNKDGKVTKYSFAKDAQYKIDGGSLTPVWNAHATRTLKPAFIGIRANYMDTLVTGFDVNANSQIVKIEFKTLTPATTAVNINSKSFDLSNDVAIYNVHGTLGELKYNVLNKSGLVSAAAPASGASPVYYFAINAKTGEIEAVVYNASVGIGNKIVVRSMPNVINDGSTVKSILAFNNGEAVEYFSKTAISVPTAPEASGVTPIPGKAFADQPNNIVPNSYRGLLIDAEVDARGYISTWSVVNANFANTAVTSSAINVLNNNKFTINTGTTASPVNTTYGLSDNAVVYYISRDNWGNMATPVVGTASDMGKSNAHVLFYNLDTTNDEFGVIHFEIVIVIDDTISQ